MANAFHLTTCGMRTHTWLDYVPSLANIADLPSRGDFELLERLGARRVEVPVVGTADWHGPLAQRIDSAAAATLLLLPVKEGGGLGPAPGPDLSLPIWTPQRFQQLRYRPRQNRN